MEWILDHLGDIATYTWQHAWLSALPTVLGLLVALPLAANTVVSFAVARWATDIEAAATGWLADSQDTTIDDVHFHGLEARIVVTDADGVVPETAPLAESLSWLPSFVTVIVDVGVGDEVPVR